jgi:hypothetical protein
MAVIGEYGSTKNLGSATGATPCATGCRVEVPAAGGHVLFYRWKYLDQNAATVAYSNIYSVLVH